MLLTVTLKETADASCSPQVAVALPVVVHILKGHLAGSLQALQEGFALRIGPTDVACCRHADLRLRTRAWPCWLRVLLCLSSGRGPRRLPWGRVRGSSLLLRLGRISSGAGLLPMRRWDSRSCILRCPGRLLLLSCRVELLVWVVLFDSRPSFSLLQPSRLQMLRRPRSSLLDFSRCVCSAGLACTERPSGPAVCIWQERIPSSRRGRQKKGQLALRC